MAIHPKLFNIWANWGMNNLFLTNYETYEKIIKYINEKKQKSRVIRRKDQDLFTSSIHSLVKDSCEIKQLALNWQDRI